MTYLAPFIDRGSFHGSDVVRAMPGGLFELPGDVDRMLDAAADAGWIVRGIYQPTAEQRFFGAERKEIVACYAFHGSPSRFYAWITNWDAWDAWKSHQARQSQRRAQQSLR